MQNEKRSKIYTYKNGSRYTFYFRRFSFFLFPVLVVLSLYLMAEVWGNLPKAQDDSETIEEAISRIVSEHNNAPTAHTEAGQSIALHRETGIIDHPEGSVLGDKFTNQDFVIQPLFEDSAIYSKSTAGLTFGLGGVRMDTTTTINTLRFLKASGQYSHAYVKEDKMITFQCSASINNDTNVIAYIGAGGFGLSGEPPGFGFKIHNGSLYAVASYWGPVTFQETLEQILGVTVTQRHYYRVQVIPDEGVAVYYIDGTEVARIDIPSNDDYGLLLFELNVKNLTATQKILNVSNIYLSISTQ